MTAPVGVAASQSLRLPYIPEPETVFGSTGMLGYDSLLAAGAPPPTGFSVS
jgi:hypothetical protein